MAAHSVLGACRFFALKKTNLEAGELGKEAAVRKLKTKNPEKQPQFSASVSSAPHSKFKDCQRVDPRHAWFHLDSVTRTRRLQEIAQLATSFPCKHEDPGLVPRTIDR